MDWVEAGCSHKEQGFLWVRNRFFTKEAWICRNVDTAILLGLFLGLTAFWNGAALIGGLLILAGLAVFSDGKLDYVICAGLAVLFSELQSKIFVSGSVMSPSFYWGFLADNKMHFRCTLVSGGDQWIFLCGNDRGSSISEERSAGSADGLFASNGICISGISDSGHQCQS